MSDPLRRLLRCRDVVHGALLQEMSQRHEAPGLSWVDNERLAVAVAANNWATANPPARTVSVEDVERIETRAVGHVDYASKLALYVAEEVLRDV